MNKLLLLKIKSYLKDIKTYNLHLLFYRGLFSDLRFNILKRYFFFKKLNFLNFSSCKNLLVCKKSGRTTGVINGFFEFRMFFKIKNLFGKYSGIKKSSW